MGLFVEDTDNFTTCVEFYFNAVVFDSFGVGLDGLSIDLSGLYMEDTVTDGRSYGFESNFSIAAELSRNF